jgi:hypothetical protein
LRFVDVALRSVMRFIFGADFVAKTISRHLAAHTRSRQRASIAFA